MRAQYYIAHMNTVTRTLELDAETDARVRQLADKRGQKVEAVLAEAVALLDSTIELGLPDVADDRRRYNEYLETGMAVPLDEVKAWTASWGTAHELPPPKARKLR